MCIPMASKVCTYMYVLNYLVLRSSLNYARLFLFLIATHSVSVMNEGSLTSVVLSMLAL